MRLSTLARKALYDAAVLYSSPFAVEEPETTVERAAHAVGAGTGFGPPDLWGGATGGDPFDDAANDHPRQFRQISGPGYWNRDVQVGKPWRLDNAQEWARYLWQVSAAMKRLHRLTAGYIVGPHRPRFNAASSIFDRVLNEWSQRTEFLSQPHKVAMKFRLFGELPIMLEVGKGGKVTSRTGHPSSIRDVVFRDRYEEQPELVLLDGYTPRGERPRMESGKYAGLRLVTPESEGEAIDALWRNWWPVVRHRNTEERLPGVGGKHYPVRFRRNDLDMSDFRVEDGDFRGTIASPLIDGLVVYARHEPIVSPRGFPAYIEGFHLFDQFEKVFFDALRRVKLLWSMVWHLIYNDAAPQKLIEELQKRRVFQTGEVFVSNEGVQLEAKNPALNMADLSGLMNDVRINLAQVGGVPLMMLSEDSSTLAHALAQGEPTLRATFEPARVEIVEEMFRPMAQSVLDAFVYHSPGRGFETKSREIQIELPDMSTDDTTTRASVLGQILPVADAVDRQAIDPALGKATIEKIIETSHLLTRETIDKILRPYADAPEETRTVDPGLRDAVTGLRDALRRGDELPPPPDIAAGQE